MNGSLQSGCNLIDYTGFTSQGDEVAEWHDDETQQYAVTLDREPRGYDGIDFYFETRASAHVFFLALCDLKSVYVAGEGV